MLFESYQVAAMIRTREAQEVYLELSARKWLPPAVSIPLAANGIRSEDEYDAVRKLQQLYYENLMKPELRMREAIDSGWSISETIRAVQKGRHHDIGDWNKKAVW